VKKDVGKKNVKEGKPKKKGMKPQKPIKPFKPKKDEKKAPVPEVPVLDELEKEREEISKLSIRNNGMKGKPPPSSSRAREEDISVYCTLIRSDEKEKQLEGTRMMRHLLSLEWNPPVAKVLASGIVPELVTLMAESPDVQIQIEACWCITNIASSTSQHTMTVVELGVVPILGRLLLSDNLDLVEQTIWCLGNIAGDCTRFRDFVLKHSVLKELVRHAETCDKLSLLRNCTWTISNLTRGKPQPPFETVRPAIPTLLKLLYSMDHQVLSDALWALSYLSDGSNPQIEAVLAGDSGRRMVELMLHISSNVQVPALRCIGNCLSGDDSSTEKLIQAGVLLPLRTLVASQKKSIRKEACWAVSNITAGSPTQITAVIKSGILPAIIARLTDSAPDVRKEASWVICNLSAGGSNADIMAVLELNPLQVMIPIMAGGCMGDVGHLKVIMESIRNFLNAAKPPDGGENPVALTLEELGAVEVLEALQTHENNEIYEMAVQILETHFGAEQVDPNDQPQPAFNISVNAATNTANSYNFSY